MFILYRIDRKLHSLERLELKFDSSLEFFYKIPVTILLDVLFGEFRFSKASFALASASMTSWNQCFYHKRQARLHTVDSIDSVPQLEYTKVNLLQIYSTMIFGPLNYFKEISVQILQLNNSSKTSDFYSLFQLFLCWDRVNGKCPQFPLVIRQDISRFFPGISGLLLHAVLKYAEGLERGNAVYLPTHEEEEDLYVHTRKISITKHPKELLTRKFYLYFHSSIRPLFRDLFTVQHHTMYFQIEN